MSIKDFQTAVRFPKDIVDRLDAIAEAMSDDRRGIKVTRAGLIRVMVMESLGSFEKIKAEFVSHKKRPL